VPFFRALAIVGIFLAAQGCSVLPDPPERHLLEHAGWARETLAVSEFQLPLFSESIAPDTAELHIYLGGDGRAFLSRQRVARDPTSREHLGLRLAIADPAPSLFLARPCYYGEASSPACDPTLWTVDRYSPKVVAAVVAGLQQVVERYPEARVTLVGYSGGGVIALLAAREVSRVTRIITIAAPLDTAAWTSHHGYTELSASSNPAALGSWREELVQLHLVGEDDREVPGLIARSYQERTGLKPPRSEVVTLSGYDHRCCWLESWPATLSSLADAGAVQPSRK